VCREPAPGVDRGYDGTTAAGVLFGDDRIGGDDLTVSGSGAFGDKHVGTGKSVTVSGMAVTGGDAGNYTLANRSTATSASISAAAVTVAAAADAKVYDGTTSSGGAPAVVAGTLFDGDSGDFGQAFDNRHAGTGKTLTANGTMADGNGGRNYVVTFQARDDGVIHRKAITVAASADRKVYDGTVASAGAPAVTSGAIVAGDRGAFSQQFADRNAGTGKTLLVAGQVEDGNGGNNYDVQLVNSTAGAITPRQLAASGGAGVNRTYDATRNATLTGTITLDGSIQGDDVGVSGYTARFADKNVGTGKGITAELTLGGADAGNYTVQAPTGLEADITPKRVTVSGLAAQAKVYDGTTAATLAGTPTANGVFEGDAVTIAGAAGSFADKNAGSGKAVKVDRLTVSGADAVNYAFQTPSALSADITPAPLTIQAHNQSKLAGAVKTFNGTEFTASGLVAGEQVASVTLASAGAAASAPSGAYAIAPSSAVGGSGFSASNYAITYLNGALAVFAADVQPAVVQVNNQVVTFAALFVEMARAQQERPDGQPDIVLTDTSCAAR
jgi:hypothetical protein